MPQYQATITVADATLRALAESGSALQVLQAVRSPDGAARPLLWMSLRPATWTEVTWTDDYSAYTAASPIRAGQPVRAGFSARIEPGQLLSVRAGGAGDVTWSRYPERISVLNTTDSAYTCGLAAGPHGDAQAPFCAIPLYGGHLQFIAPVARILLRFSTWPLAAGTVIDDGTATRTATSSSPSVLASLTGTTARALSYDINAGWSWGGYSWARQFPAGEPLIRLLIEQPDQPPSL